MQANQVEGTLSLKDLKWGLELPLKSGNAVNRVMMGEKSQSLEIPADCTILLGPATPQSNIEDEIAQNYAKEHPLFLVFEYQQAPKQAAQVSSGDAVTPAP